MATVHTKAFGLIGLPKTSSAPAAKASSITSALPVTIITAIDRRGDAARSVSWGFNSPRGAPSLARKEVKVCRRFAARARLSGSARQSQLLSGTGAGLPHNPNTSSSFQDPDSQSARLPSRRPDRQHISPHAHGSSTTRACGNHPCFAPLMSLLPLLPSDAMRIRGSTFSPKPLSLSQPMCYKKPESNSLRPD